MIMMIKILMLKVSLKMSWRIGLVGDKFSREERYITNSVPIADTGTCTLILL